VFPPTAVAPIVVEVPVHIALFVPAFAAGKGFTVTTTEFCLLHVVAVMVSVRVYVVVMVGETLGLAVVDVKPTGLDTQL